VGDDALEVNYTAGEYEEVEQNDAQFVDQTATDEYAIHQFRKQHINNTDVVDVLVDIRSLIGAVAETIYLQVLNRNSGIWETLSSNNTALVNQEFTLTGKITSNISYYYSVSFWVAFRVYQYAGR